MFSLISIWKYLLLVCLVISFLQVESHFNIALFGGKKETKKGKTKENIHQCVSVQGLHNVLEGAVREWPVDSCPVVNMRLMRKLVATCNAALLLQLQDIWTPVSRWSSEKSHKTISVSPPVASAPQFQAVVLKHQGCSGVRRVTTLPYRVNLLENNKKYTLLRLYV